jgi:hypothetical protein
MERLQTIKKDALATYKKHKKLFPRVPRVPLVEATMVPATSLFAPQTFKAGKPGTIISEPIFLQTGSNEVHSFAIDLSGLHPGIVFSVVLSNSSDLQGKGSKTILVRNGVTATAARKRVNEKAVWFYHGKPMNDGDMRLHVSIGRDQMTFAYYEDGDDRLYVHGDCPVSRLSVDEIGDVKDIPFHVYIYTKDKNAGTRQHLWPATLEILDIEGKGYIHESSGQDERNNFGFELIEPEDIESDEEVVGEDARLINEIAEMELRQKLLAALGGLVTMVE